jgi:hypothetical protein
VLPLNGIQIHDTKRKIVFPNIKNKFRFVTVSLILASLVTVVSSASAEEEVVLYFDVQVTSCTDGGDPASWAPILNVDSDVIVVPAGTSGSVTALTGLVNGYLDCDDDRGNVTGSIMGELDIPNPDPSGPAILDPMSSGPQMTCGPGCAARDMGSGDLLDSVTMTFDVNPLADSDVYVDAGEMTLTWTPVS